MIKQGIRDSGADQTQRTPIECKPTLNRKKHPIRFVSHLLRLKFTVPNTLKEKSATSGNHKAI